MDWVDRAHWRENHGEPGRPRIHGSTFVRHTPVKYRKSQNGRQSGDPAKLARVLITIASPPPPRRFIASADPIGTADQKMADLKAQIEAYRGLSASLAFD